MNLFKPKPSQKLQVIQRLSSRVRLHEWRSSPDLVTSARKVLNDGTLQTMMDVLKNEHPFNTTLYNVSIEERAVVQARTEGYAMALANLEAMGVFQKPTEPIEATYEQNEELIPTFFSTTPS